MLTDIAITVTPAVTVLQDTSRFLLTIGVGLFVAYLVLIISANSVGFLHRHIATVLRGNDGKRLTGSQPSQSQQVRGAGHSRVLEREAL